MGRIDREGVREIVAKNQIELRAEIRAGRNPYHLTLKQKDRLKYVTRHLDPETVEEFMEIYIEEMDAATRATLDEAERLNEKTAEINAEINAKTTELKFREIEEKFKWEQFGAGVGLFLILLLILFTFKPGR